MGICYDSHIKLLCNLVIPRHMVRWGDFTYSYVTAGLGVAEPAGPIASADSKPHLNSNEL